MASPDIRQARYHRLCSHKSDYRSRDWLQCPIRYSIPYYCIFRYYHWKWLLWRQKRCCYRLCCCTRHYFRLRQIRCPGHHWRIQRYHKRCNSEKYQWIYPDCCCVIPYCWRLCYYLTQIGEFLSRNSAQYRSLLWRCRNMDWLCPFLNYLRLKLRRYNPVLRWRRLLLWLLLRLNL